MTNQQIKKWFSAERKYAAWQNWTRQNGRGISSRTLRRALEREHPTPRQQKAIDMAEQYIRLVTAPDHAPGYALPGMFDTLRAA